MAATCSRWKSKHARKDKEVEVAWGSCKEAKCSFTATAQPPACLPGPCYIFRLAKIALTWVPWPWQSSRLLVSYTAS